MDIAKILKERRLANGIFQHDLAIHCGFTNRANISKLETGKLEWKWRDVIKACELLKLEIVIKEA
ncbi:MAG: helix-turn-helix transcriptional regulator [Desulfatiglandales bacterium]